MTDMQKIFSLFCLLFFPSIFLSATNCYPKLSLNRKIKCHDAIISIILNNSRQAAEIYEKSKKEVVRPGKVILKQKFRVPFISMKQHMKQIINDLPYIPSNAIRLKTHSGVFGLWEDERGILYCQEKNTADENIVQKLIDAQKLRLAISLTLKINQSGGPEAIG